MEVPAVELRRAVDAATAGDRRAMLDHLLAAWRMRPAVAIADAIDLVSGEPHLPQLAGRGARARKAWLDGASRRDPRDLPALLATLVDDNSKVATERLEALDPWPADPRIETRLFELLCELHHHGRSTRPFWIAVLDRARKARDPRVLARLPFVRVAFQRFDTSNIDPMLRRLERLTGELTARLGDPPTLDPDERELIDRLRACGAPPGPTRAQLLDAVFADPADDGPRLVYADWLQQRGDPHGELITLQILGGDQARANMLLVANKPRWLGPIGPVVLDGNSAEAQFERGFLAVCKLRPEADLGIGSPWWRTVRVLDGGVPALTTHPALHGLERLVSRHVCWRALAAGVPRPLLELDTRILVSDRPADWDDQIRALAAGATLPVLRSLTIAMREWLEFWHEPPDGWRPSLADYAPLLAGPLVRHLDTLILECAISSTIGAWIAAVRRSQTSASQVRLFHGPAARSTVFVLRRDPDGELRLHAVHCYWPRLQDAATDDVVALLCTQVASIEPDHVASLELELSYEWSHRPQTPRCVDACRRLAAVAGRFPRVAAVSIARTQLRYVTGAPAG